MIKKYWWVGVIMILVGLLHVAPYVHFEHSLGERYEGIFMAGTYDEDIYLSFINQERVGKSAFGNLYIYESSNEGNNFRYFFIESTVGRIADFLDIKMDRVAVAIKFIGSALLFAVLFVLGRSLTKSNIGATLTALLVELGDQLATHPFSVGHSFLFYDRPINPGVTAIFFFLAIFLLWKVFENNKRAHALWLGVLVGAMSYLYFYYFAFLMILLPVLLVIALIKKDRALATNIIFSIVIAIITALPFFVSIYDTLGSATSAGTNLAKNYILTHRLIVERVLIAPLALLSIFAFVCKIKNIKFPKRFVYITALLVSGIIASNQQVITGMEIQQHHFHFMTNIPMLLLFGGVFGWYILSLLPRNIALYRYVAIAIMSIAIIGNAVWAQTVSYKFWYDESANRQRWSSSFNWLNVNTESNDVVLANFDMSESLPVYTHNYVYAALHAATYPVPTSRLEHNYFATIFLDGVRSDNAREYMTEHRNEMGQYIFEGQYWRAKCGSFGCFPDSIFDKLVSDFKTFASRPFEENLKKYRLDYIAWDTKRNPTWHLDTYPFLSQVFSEDSVNVYKLR